MPNNKVEYARKHCAALASQLGDSKSRPFAAARPRLKITPEGITLSQVLRVEASAKSEKRAILCRVFHLLSFRGGIVTTRRGTLERTVLLPQ